MVLFCPCLLGLVMFCLTSPMPLQSFPVSSRHCQFWCRCNVCVCAHGSGRSQPYKLSVLSCYATNLCLEYMLFECLYWAHLPAKAQQGPCLNDPHPTTSASCVPGAAPDLPLVRRLDSQHDLIWKFNVAISSISLFQTSNALPNVTPASAWSSMSFVTRLAKSPAVGQVSVCDWHDQRVEHT